MHPRVTFFKSHAFVSFLETLHDANFRRKKVLFLELEESLAKKKFVCVGLIVSKGWKNISVEERSVNFFRRVLRGREIERRHWFLDVSSHPPKLSPRQALSDNWLHWKFQLQKSKRCLPAASSKHGFLPDFRLRTDHAWKKFFWCWHFLLNF